MLFDQQQIILSLKTRKPIIQNKVNIIAQTYNITSTSPLPIMRRSIPNSKSLRARLSIKGHKYFSKFIASGEDTEKTLNRISKTRTLKFIYSLEFDPYFCEVSCMKSLARILQRLKRLKKLNLMIRRVDTTDEITTLNPYISKLRRLEKIQLKFPKTLNITENGLIRFSQAIGKCYSIKSLDYEFIDCPALTSRCNWNFLSTQRRLIYVEESKIYVTSGDNSTREEFAIRTDFKPFRASRMKRIEMGIYAGSEWSFQDSENSGLGVRECLTVFKYYINLKEMSMKAIRLPVDSNSIFAILGVLAQCASLEILVFELLSCPVSDNELIAFSCGVSKMPSLKKLTFKARHNLDISTECIIQCLGMVLKTPNLCNFDILLGNIRGLNLGRESMNQFTEQFVMLDKDIKCTFFKNSLNITK